MTTDHIWNTDLLMLTPSYNARKAKKPSQSKCFWTIWTMVNTKNKWLVHRWHRFCCVNKKTCRYTPPTNNIIICVTLPEKNHLVYRPQHEWQVMRNWFVAENCIWLAAANEGAECFDRCCCCWRKTCGFCWLLQPVTQIWVASCVWMKF